MRILCIGDSNTWGFNPENGLRHEKRWTKTLQKLLPDDEIIEEGLIGRTFNFVDPFYEERCGINFLPMLLMSHQPIDLVIIMLGTNDLKTVFHASAKVIAKGAGSFIRTINNPYLYKYPVPQILMISPISLHEEIEEREGKYGNFNNESLFQSYHLGEEIEKVCMEYEVNYFNASNHAKASPIDCIHMDEENHQTLARAICGKIKEIKLKNE